MLHEEKINFQIKGSRTYVHGTDIYDSMLTVVKKYFGKYPSMVTGSFHHLLKRNGLYRIYKVDQVLDHEGVSSLFSIIIEKKGYKIGIYSADKLISSYEYDEEKVIESMCYDVKSVRMSISPEYTYIEQIVAMTKKLHLYLYPKAEGKWLFTKIQLKDYIDPKLFVDHSMKIEAKKNLHYKLTQNSIFLDEQLIGQIWFSSANSKGAL